jgi:cystathionine beta-lyase/cystathionine gamma-synthase
MKLLKTNAWFWRNGFFQFRLGEDAIGFLENLYLAESLGGVESLANYSVMMAHRFPKKIKEKKLESPMI